MLAKMEALAAGRLTALPAGQGQQGKESGAEIRPHGLLTTLLAAVAAQDNKAKMFLAVPVSEARAATGSSPP